MVGLTQPQRDKIKELRRKALNCVYAERCRRKRIQAHQEAEGKLRWAVLQRPPCHTLPCPALPCPAGVSVHAQFTSPASPLAVFYRVTGSSTALALP